MLQPGGSNIKHLFQTNRLDEREVITTEAKISPDKTRSLRLFVYISCSSLYESASKTHTEEHFRNMIS
jgi:hypothetical protein